MLLSSDLEKLLNTLIPEFRAENQKLYIPIKAFYNLKQQGERYKERIEDFQTLYKRGLIEFIGEMEDIHADATLYPKMIGRLLRKYSITFFTADENLAREIVREAGKNRHRLTLLNYRNGQFVNYTISEPKESIYNPLKGSLNQIIDETKPKIKVEKGECFKLVKAVTELPDKRMDISNLPGEGDTAYINDIPIKLTKKISAGGEGTIYETDREVVAKIYKKEKLTQRKAAKLKTMVSKRIDYPGICYPKALLTNENHEFIGYTMQRAKGVELQKSVFVRKLLAKRFPDWNRLDIIELCITILEKIEYLSAHGIIIGDINPMNILVVSPKEVYFVDTDSYQIEGFPCPVGTVNFTAPEIQGESFSDFLRTPEHENFAISTLLFMLLLPGKAPYSRRGGEGPQQNILSEDFSYPYKTHYNGKIPKGPWGLIWSHLPDAIQEAFYLSFRQGERFTRKRINASGWLRLLREYRALLDNPSWIREDKEALEIFPKHYRASDPSHPRYHKKKPKPQKPKGTACRECGRYFESGELKDGLCKSCIEKKSKERLEELKRQTRRKAPPTRTTYKRAQPEPEKTLICRKCRKSFPDYEMKGGLCPSCRAKHPKSVVKSGFEKRQEEKEIFCRSCRRLFPAKEMQGGLCPDCRKKAGIPERKRPTVTISNTSRNASNAKRDEMTLICRKCRRSFPDYQMKGGLCPDCRGERTPRAPRRDSSVKELICRSCHRRFPDYEMKGGLCPSCRASQQNAYNPSRAHERMFRCSICGKSYPVSELTGGVCNSCRRQKRAENKRVETYPTRAKTRTNYSSPNNSQNDKYSKEAKEAIADFFKDVPKNELNDFVSWLLDK